MMLHRVLLLLTLVCFFLNTEAQTGQVSISRIEMMPNQPAPYNVRNWKEVAEKYDSLVFDLNLSGTHLPLTHIMPAGLNYPQRPTFRMHTYVGTNSPLGNEAINVLPTLVGSTLVGIDKSDQFGYNWVLMAQDFFNKANGENLYLNNAGARSGNDWWYDMMPNIYFYQMYDLYPNMGGDAAFQFSAVADQLMEAVQAMGGQDAPWESAYMNYRAWNFQNMEPNATGVPEPEAAGSFAWLLYHAYKQTNEPDYLKGAEWAIEFLDTWPNNPSYELQLPYGTYTAAKMNAELGTAYDVEKMVNWSFDRGSLRGWGTIVGSWGSFGVSGLVGEANDNGNDYAFQMNGMQQAAALVPMVRYDKRFARAIGKWVLHMANASRLFYHRFLPASLQDASDWSSVYDPDQVIGYEALREQWQGNSPFSTGDAVRGGWAATNLALYGTSAVGYLGALIEKTDTDKILKIDLLKTDFFNDEAYPVFLFYNPYSTAQTIQFDLGDAPADLYEALSETFLQKNVTTSASLTIPPDEAIMVVVCPVDGNITYDKNRMLINGVVVDYDQHAQTYTYSPRFKGLAAAATPLEAADSTSIFATISDADSDQFSFEWRTSKGEIKGQGEEVLFKAPAELGDVDIECIVEDPEGNRDTAQIILPIVERINQAPQIIALQKSAEYVAGGGNLEISCLTTDDVSEELIYEWTTEAGTITGNGDLVQWDAPTSEGIYQITVQVTDEDGLSSTSSTSVLVKNFVPATGNIIADYPFSGNAEDVSGNDLDGQVFGVIPTVDPFGNQQSAYYFNGGAQHIAVSNDPILNFQDQITVSCWFKANALPDKETFLLSHGSWQNRWKLSITPDRLVRWTINSPSGIRDLDAPIPLQVDSFYQVTATFDGELMALYLGGQLHAYRLFNGKIRPTSLAFLVGQMLPEDANFNFKGVIDEVKIFDYALTPTQADSLYSLMTTSVGATAPPASNAIRVFPNPASNTIRIDVAAPDKTVRALLVYDANGRLIFEQSIKESLPYDINISNYNSGIYTILLVGEKQVYSSRFIKW